MNIIAMKRRTMLNPYAGRFGRPLSQNVQHTDRQLLHFEKYSSLFSLGSIAYRFSTPIFIFVSFSYQLPFSLR